MGNRHDCHPDEQSAQGRVASHGRGRASLSRGQIHDALTDVSAVMYMLEAERLRMRGLLSREGADREPETAETKSLEERHSMVESKIEELEARAAYLRAELVRASRESSAG